METTKVIAAVKRLRRQKNVQEKVLNKIEATANRGKYSASFSQISDLMIDKLRNQKFGITIVPRRERELPENIKCTVDWENFLKLKK